MIDRLEGRIVGRGASLLHLQVGPLTLEVHTPGSTLAAVGQDGDEVALWTDLQWKEDGPTLFGFSTPVERQLFRLLLGVQGVGPRIALSVLTHSPPAELVSRLRARDADALTRVPGIGAKTAGRIVVDLGPQADRLELGPGSTAEPLDSAAHDVVLALTALGYPTRDARRAVLEASQDEAAAELDERLRRALRRLATASSRPGS